MGAKFGAGLVAFIIVVAGYALMITAQEAGENAYMFTWMLLRIGFTIAIVNIAKKIGKSPWGWGILGFIFPGIMFIVARVKEVGYEIKEAKYETKEE